jgi:hypothetical protein
MEWKPRTRALIGNTNGTIDTVVMQSYFAPLDEWKNSKRVIHLYNTGNLLIEKKHQRWYHYTGLWGDHHRSVLTYNTDNKIEEVVFQGWKPVLQAWANKSRDEFSYDTSGSLEERLTQLWQHQDSSWINFRLMQILIEYKTAFAGIGDNATFNNGEKLVFANPFTGDQPITFESLEADMQYRFTMYSLSGAVMEDVLVSDGDRIIPSGNLGPGIYILSLTRNDIPAVTEKMIIP